MRVVIEMLCQRRSRLVAFGFIGAPAVLILASWLQGGRSSQGRPVSAGLCRPSVLRRTAVIASCHDDDSVYRASDERGLPELAADVTPPPPSTDPPEMDPSSDSEPDATPPRFDDLVMRFRQNCACCHGDDGTGNIVRMKLATIPDFTSPDWQFSQTEDAIINRTADGSVPLMPSFRDRLSPQEMLELAIYVRTFIGRAKIDAEESVAPASVDRRPPAAVTHADVVINDESPRAPTADVASRMSAGAGIFRQHCVACHGADGTGGKSRAQMPPIPDFTNSIWQTRHTDSKLIASILDGKGTLMPANRGRITDAQARDLVAYLRSFGPQTARRKGPASESEFEKAFRELEQRWDELEKKLQQYEPPKNKK
jgi:mono/diheme cytochrome c family protein